MNKKYFSLALFMPFFLAGCQQLETVKNLANTTLDQGIAALDKMGSKGSENTWNGFQNKSIRDTFLTLTTTQNGAKVIEINPRLKQAKFGIEKRNSSYIFLNTYVLHEANFSEANRKIRMGAYIAEKDLAAKMFVEQALAQGHEVRVYKSPVNRAINDKFVQAIVEFKGAENSYGLDNAFVEFDKTGSPVAIMTRSWQTISTIGVDSRIYTQIYFAADGMRIFENSFGNKFLEDNLIRIIK